MIGIPRVFRQMNLRWVLTAIMIASLHLSCSRPAPVNKAEEKPAPPASTGPRIYVTNEVSGDLSIIDAERDSRQPRSNKNLRRFKRIAHRRS